MTFADRLSILLDSEKDLPTLPDLVLELRAALDADTSGDRKIADIIGRDPVITAKLLRVANSAAYSRSGGVTSVLGAVQRVGLREIRAICVVLAVVESFAKRPGRLDLQQFWDHSAAVGRVAQILCRRIPLRGDVGWDDVYVAGLLHDVGLLLLDQFFPEEFQQTTEAQAASALPLWQVEREILGMDHGKIGGKLIARWSLPSTIVGCISGHHEPRDAPQQCVPACCVVRASENLCTSLGVGAGIEGPSDQDTFSSLSDLGLQTDQIEAILSEIEEVGVSIRGILTT
jgi:HD-like signal output (HDOD) protein